MGYGRHIRSGSTVGSSANLTDLTDLMEGGDRRLGELVRVLVALEGVRVRMDLGPMDALVYAVDVEDVEELRRRRDGSCTRCVFPNRATFLGSRDPFDHTGLMTLDQNDRSSSSSFSSCGLS